MKFGDIVNITAMMLDSIHHLKMYSNTQWLTKKKKGHQNVHMRPKSTNFLIKSIQDITMQGQT